MAATPLHFEITASQGFRSDLRLYRKLGLEAGWQERRGGRKTSPIIRISETQKLNLYVVDRYEIESPTHAPGYALGSADFCLKWKGTV